MEQLDRLKKSELIELAQELELSVKSSFKKDIIKQILIPHLVSKGHLPEEVLKPVSVQGDSKESQVELMRLQVEMAKIEAEKEKSKIEAEKEKLKIEAERENKRLQIEADKEVQLRRIEFESQGRANAGAAQGSTEFRASQNIRLVPPFQEKQVESYFLHFEKVATNLKWPKEMWSIMLQSVLVGKASEAFSSLSVEQSANYDHVKTAILKAYELVPEAYRQKFRNARKLFDQTHVEFAREEEQLFD